MDAEQEQTTETGEGAVVRLERRDGIAIVTLNRPAVRNAINAALRRELRAAITAVEADPEVDVAILTGTDPAFCAGLDLRDLGARPSELMDPDQARGSSSPFPPRTKPLIGAVNGAAITGGFELALNCDFLIASERARFADTHARVGVMPGWGLTPLLTEAVGVRRARELSLSGNFLDADTALTWGLVNHVVPHGQLMEVAIQLASDIAANDRPGVRRMLATYDSQETARSAEAWDLEGAAARAFRADVQFDPAEVERRRSGIIERGRTQL